MFQPLQMLPPRLRCHLLKLIGLRQNYTTCLPPAPHRSWRYAASAVAAAVAAAVPATTCRYLRGLGGDASSGCTPRHPSSSSRNAAIHPYGDLNARRGKLHQCPKAAGIFGRRRRDARSRPLSLPRSGVYLRAPARASRLSPRRRYIAAAPRHAGEHAACWLAAGWRKGSGNTPKTYTWTIQLARSRRIRAPLLVIDGASGSK